ncbi:MAG: hypothetical protein ACTSRH_02720 [Promethearchaeota archaeon]
MKEKITDFKKKISKTFYKVFEPSHIFYTLIFLISLSIIAILSFIQIQNAENIALFFSTTISLTFLMLTFLGIFRNLNNTLFSPEKRISSKKVSYFLLFALISVVLISLYFIYGTSSQLPVQFLGWDILLPTIYVIMFFGWNLIQIFFLKTIFENLAEKANFKVIKSKVNSKKKKFISNIFLIISILIPAIIQLGTFSGFLDYFTPQSPGDSLTPLFWFYGWNIFMVIIMLILFWRLIYLHFQSLKNETPNIFSSMFFLFVWLLIWYRSFSFIYSFRTAVQTHGFDIIRIFMDVFLMIATAILVLRGLGGKIYKLKIFNDNNLPFFLFAFTILYVEGQVVMIIGGGYLSGIYSNRAQVNMVNNFLVLMITVFFYWYYAKYILEKKNLILKINYKQEEVIQIVKDFKEYLEERGILEKDKISDNEINDFLWNKRIQKTD